MGTLSLFKMNHNKKIGQSVYEGMLAYIAMM